MISFFLSLTLVAQPPPPPRKPTDDRRDASAQATNHDAGSLPTTEKIVKD